MNTTLKGLITSFVRAIDLYNYLLVNHHRHTAIAAYYIGKEYGLSKKRISDLVISAALHDIGALSIKERDELIKMDVENPFPHCALGSYMLDSFEPFKQISNIVYYHHWVFDRDSEWIPEKGPVPIESYILHVADRTDILINPDESVFNQKKKIIEKINSYSGTLFNPEVVDAFNRVADKSTFWLDVENCEMDSILEIAISKEFEVNMTMDLLEQFAFTLSKIIDCRSKFTISHSFGVSVVAYRISKLMHYSEEKSRKIRVAGLLHDIGKIAIPIEIIEKKGKLTEEERAEMQIHPYFTNLILKNMEGMDEITGWAACHHESHDGLGYPKNLDKYLITQEMDIISYADIYTALSEKRPYRKGLSEKEIMKILKDEYVEKHGIEVYEIIKENLKSIDESCKASIQDGVERYEVYEKLLEKQAI